MATQRRFEASSLAAVLAKVQKEVGPDAIISSAQRVRSGGMGGFFAREKFEVMVTERDAAEQVNPSTASQPQTTAQSASQEGTLSLMDLAELANSVDINDVKLTDAQTKAARIEEAIASARAIADQQTLNEPVEEPVEEPVVVLPPKVEAPKVDQPKVEAPTAEVTVEPEPQISTESDSFAEVLSRVAFQAHMTEEQDAAQREAAAERARRRDEEMIPDRPAFLDAQIVESPAPAPVAEAPVAAAPAPAPVAQATAPSTEVVVPQQRTRVSDHPLALLGLPTEFIPVGIGTEGLQDALTAALERMLPKTPQIRPSKGSVICVVGDRFEAMEIAEELAEQWGRPTEEIVLASQTYRGKGAANVLRTVRSAEDAQRSWSRRPRPTIVAIEATPGSRDSSWAEHVLTALEPIATFGVADATRKSDDIKAWADSLGGVDCLAVNNIESTVSPAAVLATGIPVDRVDGRRVTAAFWALLLTERLTAA